MLQPDCLRRVLDDSLHLAANDAICVGAIARADLLECPPELPVFEAARLMSERRVSSIVVVDDDDVVGIWTERDALAIDFRDVRAFSRPIRSVMSTPVRTVPATIGLHELALRFREEHVRHYLVENDQGRPCGIVSQSDVVLNQGVEHYLRLRKVESLVKGGLRTLPADALLGEATRCMREHATDAVVVDFGPEAAEDPLGRYGILTERDVTRMVAQCEAEQPLHALANRPLLTVQEHDSLYRVRTLLAERRFRHIGVLREDGTLAYLHELQHALQARDQALHSSQRSLRLAEKVIENSLEGVMVTDAESRIVSVNPAFCRLTGYSAEEVIGKRPSMLSSGRHDGAFYTRMWERLKAEGQWESEIWNRRKSGEIYPALLHIAAISDNDGTLTHYAALFTDISPLKETEARIRDLAYYDPLTGLPNRRLLEDRLAVELAHASRSGKRLAVMFVDLDRFKRINDSLGHEIGDRLLVEVSKRLRACLREDDTVARMGGDEFLIVLSNLDGPEDAVVTARRIVEALRRPVVIDGRELVVTTSIGISICPDDSKSATTLIKNADVAMYRAKEDGRNSYQLYQPAMNARSLEHLALETALHGALKRDELLLHFQPLIDLETGTVVAAEALLRWCHPELDLVSPADFIPLAEETGLIVPIGEWVLRNACEHHRAWREAGRGDLRMMVNISARQFRDDAFVDVVDRVLQETGMPPALLTLEVTETMLMDDVDSSIVRMHRLRALGVNLALDDFGTGYSSLAYLKRFPIEELKIDRLFVRGIDRNTRDAALVAAIISLGHSLGLRVVAEGVESEDHLKVLREQGCDVAQGFHFSVPLAWPAFMALG